jgi:transposase InsO family protein
MNNGKTWDRAREMAVFKYSVIAPLLQGTYSDASKIAYCRRAAKDPLKRPDGSLFLYDPKTLMTWAQRYAKGGLDALVTQERCDKGFVRQLSADCIREIYKLKEKFPRLNATQIYDRLIELGLVSTNVSVRTVQRFIKANQMKTGVPVAEGKDRKAFEEEYFGDMWMADTCYFPYLRDPKGKESRTYLIAIIDDHSRLIVGARLFWEDNPYNFQQVLKDAIATYGIPKKLYLDHGPAYENSQLRFICAEVGTTLIHAPVRDGAAKAKVERWFLSIKTQWIYGQDMAEIPSLEVFNQKLSDYVRKYNLTVNSSMKEDPMSRFLATRDHCKMPKSREWLDECFMNRITRKVRKDATLSLDTQTFDVPMQFISQTVEIRYLPGKLDSAYIYSDKKHFPIHLTDKVANSRTKRNSISIDYSRIMEVNRDV